MYDPDATSLGLVARSDSQAGGSKSNLNRTTSTPNTNASIEPAPKEDAKPEAQSEVTKVETPEKPSRPAEPSVLSSRTSESKIAQADQQGPEADAKEPASSQRQEASSQQTSAAVDVTPSPTSRQDSAAKLSSSAQRVDAAESDKKPEGDQPAQQDSPGLAVPVGASEEQSTASTTTETQANAQPSPQLITSSPSKRVWNAGLID